MTVDVATWTHPDFCAQGEQCVQDGTDLIHERVLAKVIPRGDPQHPITLGVQRADEVDPVTGEQTVYPVQCFVEQGGTRSHVSPDELEEYAAMAHSVANRARSV